MELNRVNENFFKIDQSHECLHIARRLILLETLRNKKFGRDAILLGNPIWHAMLKLYVATIEGRASQIDDLFPDINISLQSRQRYINILEKRRFIMWVHNSKDSEQELQMTPYGISELVTLLSTLTFNSQNI